jgi:hypothetical protein
VMRPQPFFLDPLNLIVGAFALLMLAQVIVFVGFMHDRPDAPTPPPRPPQHAVPQASASAPPKSF